MGDEARKRTMKRRLWIGAFTAFAVFWTIDYLWGNQLGITSESDSGPPAITAPPSPRAPWPPPSILDDVRQPNDAIQGDWYCWDNPPVLPHHLGHHVAGDHLCTWGELRDSGFAGPP